MRKFLGIILLALVLVAPITVRAEKARWQDSKFDFKTLKNVEITDIARVYNETLSEDDFAEQKITEYIEKYLEDKKVPLGQQDNFLLYPDATSSPLPEYSLDVTINTYGYNYYFKEGYWDYHTTWREEHFRDGRGNWHSVSVPVTESRYIPPENVRTCFVDVAFDLKNNATGKTIYHLRDVRNRETNTPDDMAKRVIKDFVEDLKKLHDKGKV